VGLPRFPGLPERENFLMLRVMGRRIRKLGQMACWVSAVAWVVVRATAVPAQEPPPPLTLDAAIRMGLERNPELMAFRQQRGVAEAGVVIADTYPFNPIWEAKVREANGPQSAGVENSVSNEHKFLIDVEIRHQRQFRRQGAAAALSRTDWEILAQEVALSIRVTRAFDTVLYRYAKQQVIDKSIAENKKATADVEKWLKARLVKPVDLIVIRAELDDVTAQLQAAHSSLVTASYDLYRALGLVNEPYRLDPTWALPEQSFDPASVVKAALERRPDRQARQFAVAEADARLRLEMANRWGNPNIGPAYEYDPTRINLIGAQFTLPLPLFNTHRGEIMQREAELGRAALELRQTEIQIEQEVYAALARLEKARAWLDTYRKQVIPNLDKAYDDVKKLFEVPDSGVTVLSVIDIQRKTIKVRDAELDAIYEVRQALADLAAAVGDPGIAVTAAPPAPECEGR
jgi:cobalt-zinc-cadmium efflux system outer membrane protein